MTAGIAGDLSGTAPGSPLTEPEFEYRVRIPVMASFCCDMVVWGLHFNSSWSRNKNKPHYGEGLILSTREALR